MLARTGPESGGLDQAPQRIGLAVALAALVPYAGCREPKPPPAPVESTQRAAMLAPGFQASVVFSGLTRPTAIRFAPDGRVFVAEKRGRIQVYDNLADDTPTEFARFDDEVHDYWDRGLLGLAVHPKFPAEPSVYVLYTLDAPPGGTPPVWKDDCPNPPGGTADGCVVAARLARLTAEGNTAGAQTVLLESWGQQYPSHSIGDLAFGADGALYVSAGDGAGFNFVDYGQRGMPKNPLGDPPVAVGVEQMPPGAQGGSLRSQSLRRPMGPAVLAGTVARLDPMTGAALPDNPLAASADPYARRIIAYGLRNPFRLTMRPGTSEIWLGEVGYNTWEEINRIVNPTDPAIENFGWPCFEGRPRQGAYDGANLAMCERLYEDAAAPATPPHFAYHHGSKVVPGEACKSGNSSPTALAFYTGDKFPPRYRGALFFADYSRECAWVMLPGADGTPDATKVESFGVELSGPVDLQMGPDGFLYYVDHDKGDIYRITYLLPKAVATATPTAGPPPLVVSFDGSGSTKPLPDDVLGFAWDLDGDGQFDDATGDKPSMVYGAAGTYQVRLRVTDQRGVAVTSDAIAITVNAAAMTSQPPVPVIEAPTAGTPWAVGDPITFRGGATDPEDGPLPASALTWMLVMRHCPDGCHSHVVRSWSGVTTGSFDAPDHDFPSHMEIVLTAEDSSGIRRSTSVRLDPRTVFVTLHSHPPGLQLALGADARPAPFGLPMIEGGRSSVAAAPVQLLAGVPFAFVAWSDGKAPSHDIGPLTMGATLSASYRPAGLTAQYFDDLELTMQKLTRIDPDVAFDWGRGSPDPAVATSFSARWTGHLLPTVSEPHTFTTESDDGIRVWVNDQLIIDAWTDHVVRRDVAAPIALTAGQKVKLRVEYFDRNADATAKLYWSSPSQPLALVPTAQLFPACVASACPAGLSCVEGECVAACTPACAEGQRCEAGKCVDACQGVTCASGKCLAGACVPKCHGVTCAAGELCQSETGRCESRCARVMCGPGQACEGGVCRPACLVNGCPPTERCNATSGACAPKCEGVTCELGFACLPETGMCADECADRACPGQVCVRGECVPVCVARGCAATEICNANTGACESKCQEITCAPGFTCRAASGECEPGCAQPPCAPDAAVIAPSGLDAAETVDLAPGGSDAGDDLRGADAVAAPDAGPDVGPARPAPRPGASGCGCDVGAGVAPARGAGALIAVPLALAFRRRRRAGRNTGSG